MKAVLKYLSVTCLVASSIWLWEDRSPEPFIALLTSIIAIIGIEKHSHHKTLNSWDSKLLNEFLESAPSSTPWISLLKDHDFTNLFHYDDYFPVHRFAETWRGGDHQFENKKINGKLLTLLNLLDEFTGKVGLYTIPVGMQPHIQGMESDERHSNRGQQHGKEMNDAASAAFAAYQILCGELKKYNFEPVK